MLKGKVILTNGPAGSGKDTIARAFEKLKKVQIDNGEMTTITFKQCENKAQLHKQATALSGIPTLEWHDRYENRELKDSPWDKLNGMTQREFLIHISEDIVKPMFGSDYYGRISANTAKLLAGLNTVPVFSDSGFQDEVDTMLKILGAENVLVVRLYREGCSFEGDSRNYVFNEAFEMDIRNDGTIDEIVQAILKKLQDA